MYVDYMSDADCVFRRKYGDLFVWLLVYVDNMLIMSKDLNTVEVTKRAWKYLRGY